MRCAVVCTQFHGSVSGNPTPETPSSTPKMLIGHLNLRETGANSGASFASFQTGGHTVFRAHLQTRTAINSQENQSPANSQVAPITIDIWKHSHS